MQVKTDCTIRFITPAFLGNAEQKGAWRSPPFKALLRQWWRVAAAAQHHYDHSRLREAEGRLFGHAWLQEGGHAWACQSKVRMKLKHWDEGGMKVWQNDSRIHHPEVGNVGAHLYLGYGPLTHLRGQGTTIKNPPAIDAGKENALFLACPNIEGKILLETLQLIHWFGTLGGRSRNGWGSLSLLAEGLMGTDVLLSGKASAILQPYARPLLDCLGREWPHALGKDQQGLLIWKTAPCTDWSSALKLLAEVKIAFRTCQKFTGPAGPFMPRHLLAYPVTKHNVREWGNQSRLANQLRFKVVQQADGRYVGLAFHLPCDLPHELKKELATGSKLTPNYQASIWSQVHQVLDHKMTRIPGGKA